MSIQTLELQPPAGFDPNNSQHVARIFEKVVEAERKKAGASDVTEEMGDNRSDWKVLSYDAKANKLTIYRQTAVTQIEEDKRGVRTVSIPSGTKAGEAEGIAARLQEMHPGYYLTEFNPHLGRAQLSKMTLDEVRVREATATAIGVRPWDLKVKGSRSAGYQVTLPSTYMQSKHDDKIQEVAETIAGEFGWYWSADPVSLKGAIVPSVPPTFPPSIGYPMHLLPKPSPGVVNPIPFGMSLATRGDEENEVIWLRLEDGPHTQIGGTSGSGKRTALRTRIPTPTGWTTMGTLKVGESVLGRDGTPCRVVHISDTFMTPDLYRITFSDGQTVDADFDHQWVVSDFIGRNNHRRDKHQRAISNHEEKISAVVELRRLAKVHRGAHFTLDELHRVAGAVPGTGWGLVESVRSLLVFMEVPHHKVARLVSRAASEETVRLEPLSGFATAPALRAIAADQRRPLASRGSGIRQPRAKSLATAAAADAAHTLSLPAEVTARELSGILTENGADITHRSVTLILQRQNIEPVKGWARKVQPASPMSTMTKHVNAYDAYDALNAMAARLEFLTLEAPRLGHDERILTTGDMLAEGLTAHNAGTQFAVRVATALDLPDADLPVAPYTFGAWLGDGFSCSSEIVSMDPEIINEVNMEGYKTTNIRDNHDYDRARIYRFKDMRAGLRSFLNRAPSSSGHKLDKRIPTAYLRASYAQRLAVLQGLMDTDGTISKSGTCELSLNKRDLAEDALELIRSLGIKASWSEGESAYKRDGVKVVTGTRHRIKFTTTLPVFRLPRKLERVPSKVRETQQWLYIESIEPIATEPARCIQVDSSDSTYLVGGFIPTHNTVTINSIIAGALGAGAELAIVDVPAKAVDYELWRPFVRKGGWGCESFEENAVMLQEIYNEGARRAAIFKQYGAKKLTELPADILATMPPVVIVCDEVTGLFAPANEKPPRGLPSDHPLVIEAESKATASALIQSYSQKIAAELRFVGFKLILATQVASTATGIGTALRTNLQNKLLVGARATDGNRKLILADVTSAPEIPKHIQQAEGLIPKGVGVSELEAQRPSVFKSFYASEKDFIAELNKRGIHGLPATQIDITRPDPAKVKDAFPESFAAAESARLEEKKFGAGPQQLQDWQVDPVTGKKLDPLQAANRAKHLLTVQAKQAAGDGGA